ncbi:MAG: hypothetical protein IJ365_03875 [Clostridia bacterium]|nr:hypothetical protein [Clostridia bacterium]
MIAVTKQGNKIQIPFRVTKEPDYISVSVTADYDYSDIRTVELDYFGMLADNSDSGYFVFPRATTSDAPMDYSLCYLNRHKDNCEVSLKECNMPVFGLKSADMTFVAVVSGMSYDYELKVSLKDGKYNAYPVFNMDGEQPYEDLKIEYFFLHGEDADYSGMARRYRQYRLDKGEVQPIAQRMKTNDDLKYCAESVVVRIRCGWKPAPSPVPHQTLDNEPPMHVACDFARCCDIVDELKKQGVEKAELCLVGWNVSGHDGRWPQTFPVEPKLGGEEGLKKLIAHAQKNGYTITCHTNSTDMYEIADVFDVQNCRYDKSGNAIIDPGAWSGGQTYQLCPKIGYEQALEILPKVRELGFRGGHYIDVVGVVFPRRCFHKEHYLNFGESAEYSNRLMQFARDTFGTVSTEGAYDHVVPSIDYGLYVSFDVPRYSMLLDEHIPFWQLVYHGTVLSNPRTCTVNASIKGDDEFLKMIEYGGRPSFYFYSKFTNNGNNWMGNDDAVADTDAQLAETVSKIKYAYDAYAALGDTVYAHMEHHQKISSGMYKIRYSNGAVITVDYNKKQYTVEK